MTRIEWRAYEVGHCRHPECMTLRGGRLSGSRFPSLAFRLRHPRHGDILFDTGYSAHFFAATRRFPERLYRWVTPVRLEQDRCLRAQLQDEGIAADSIGGIVLSHLHGDHVGGVRDFPGARLWCSRAGWDDLARRGRLSALRVGLLPSLFAADAGERMHWIEQTPATALAAALDGFGQGHDLLGDRSLVAVALPGHSVGQYGLLFNDRDGPVFLIADAAWSSHALRTRTPPPRITTAWLGNSRRYLETFDRLCGLVRTAPGLRLVPSHCAEWSAAGG